MNENDAATKTATLTYCNQCRRDTEHREKALDRVCRVCAWRTAKTWRAL